ncbi:lipopolysaccharide biosynthesis protein [Halobellus inordinatus]|uniref:lipopolysaccharide biosynthesis protein n=1 Tax=Halobellus inordinatus TaxID=1126236 RepID=UPI0021159CB8|nr:oligosaccharide flippase family protein [Halobellus ramosii]
MSDDTPDTQSVVARLKLQLTRLKNDSLFRSGSLLVATGLLSGGLNYLFQVLVGRLLSPTKYGVFGALYGLVYLLTVISIAVGYCATRYVAILNADHRLDFMRGFTLRVAALAAIVFTLLLIIAPLLADFLHLSDPKLVVLVAATLAGGLFLELGAGYVKGLQHFRTMASFEIAEAVFKLVAGVGLVILGAGVYGAIGGVVVAILTVVLGYGWHLRKLLRNSGQSAFDRYNDVYRYAMPALLVGFCATVPTNGDVVLVRHLFTPVEAGYYAAIAVFGKVLVFLPGGVTAALFPKAASQDDGDAQRTLLFRALAYTGVPLVLVIMIFVIIPGVLVDLLFGPEYRPAAELLPWYGAAMGVFALNSVLLKYLLACRRTRLVWLYAIVTVLELLGIFLFADSLLGAVHLLLVANGSLFIIGLVGVITVDNFLGGADSD